MRSLLFLFTCARAGSERDAAPAVRMAPVLRKVLRVTGEEDCCFVFIMARPHHAWKSGRLKERMKEAITVYWERQYLSSSTSCRTDADTRLPEQFGSLTFLQQNN